MNPTYRVRRCQRQRIFANENVRFESTESDSAGIYSANAKHNTRSIGSSAGLAEKHEQLTEPRSVKRSSAQR